jgi:hypothetical protein
MRECGLSGVGIGEKSGKTRHRRELFGKAKSKTLNGYKIGHEKQFFQEYF